VTLFAGLDARDYPGRLVMEAMWQRSNLLLTGMYLDSPALAPGELVVQPVPPPGAVVNSIINGHNRAGTRPPPNAGTAWMRAWPETYPAWGTLFIYWGQQDPLNVVLQANGTWQAQGPFDLRTQIAVANAEDAAAKLAAAAAGVAGPAAPAMPAGAAVYIDYEIAGAPVPNGLAYLRAFFHRLAELGLRPGVYCHPSASLPLRQECPGLLVWNVHNANSPPAPPAGQTFQVVGDTVQVATPPITAPGRGVIDPDALSRQWRLDVPAQPPPNPISLFPDFDADLSLLADPTFPERRCLPAEIRGGGVTGHPGNPARLQIYALRRGKPRAATWSPGAGATDPSLDTGVLPYLWNPFAPPSALRTPATTDLLLALGYATADRDDIWRLQALRRPAGGAWAHETVPNGDFVIDPLPGVVAATRSDESVEAFVADTDTGLLTGARRDPATGVWSTLGPLAAPGGPATTPVRRTNRGAAVSRSAGLLDLFWVGTDGLVHTTSSGAPGQWGAPVQVGDPAVTAHPFANLVAVSRAADRIDVLFIGRSAGTPDWRLYDVWWDAAGGWGAGAAQTQIAGGVLTALEPLGAIAGHSRAPAVVDVFAVSDGGALLLTTLDQATGQWSALSPVGGQPVVGRQPLRLASVATACSQGATDVEVVTTARDGNVYATHWDTALPNYTTLERVIPLDLA
jgi:hypothetical protein